MSFTDTPVFDEDRWDIPLNANLDEIKDAIGTPTTIAGHTTTLATHTADLASQGARVGRTRISLFADFSDYSNGALTGISPEIGDNTWLTSGAQLPTVTSGKVSSTGSGYLYTLLNSGSFFLIGGDFSFGGSYGASGATLAISRDEPDLLNDFAHLNFGAEGFVLTIRKDGGAFETVLADGWSAKLPLDGTAFRFALMIEGENIAVFGPSGEVYATTDHRITAAISAAPSAAFWQATTANATDGYLHRAFAFSRDSTRYPNLLDFTDAVMAGVLNSREPNRAGFSGGYGTAGDAYIGPNISGAASMRFGARFIVTELAAQMAISATTFSADRLIPSGSTVRMGIGDNLETFTTNGFPSGSGPYVHTVTVAATKAHPIGEGILATGMPVKEIYQSLGDGSLNMPSFVVQDSTNYFFGGDYTVKFERPASDVFGLADGDSFDLQGTHDGGNIRLRDHYIWVDATGDLRIKATAPSSDLDGTVVGSQS